MVTHSQSRPLLRETDRQILYSAGEVIFQQGEDDGHRLYIIEEGEVEIVDHYRTTDVLGKGDVFGEEALANIRRRSITAIARSDVQLTVIDARQFAYMLDNTPHFALKVMRVLGQRLHTPRGVLV